MRSLPTTVSCILSCLKKTRNNRFDIKSPPHPTHRHRPKKCIQRTLKSRDRGPLPNRTIPFSILHLRLRVIRLITNTWPARYTPAGRSLATATSLHIRSGLWHTRITGGGLSWQCQAHGRQIHGRYEENTATRHSMALWCGYDLL